MLKERIVILRKQAIYRVVNLITHDDHILIGDFTPGLSKLLHSFTSIIDAKEYFGGKIATIEAEGYKVLFDESIEYPF